MRGIQGFAGQKCEVVLEQCDQNPCRNDALCFIVDDEYECFCVPDFHGKKCEYKYNDCLLPPLPKYVLTIFNTVSLCSKMSLFIDQIVTNFS